MHKYFSSLICVCFFIMYIGLKVQCLPHSGLATRK